MLHPKNAWEEKSGLGEPNLFRQYVDVFSRLYHFAETYAGKTHDAIYLFFENIDGVYDIHLPSRII